MIPASAVPVGLALLCGGVFAFAFPPFSWVIPGFLALIGLAACVQRAASSKAAFWTGYAFGAGQFVINFAWIANAFSVREGFSYSQGLAAVMALAFVMALYPAAASLAAFRLSGRAGAALKNSWVFAPAFAFCWLLSECLRSVLFTGFPWNPVGAIWGEALVVAQTARLFGVYGLGALTVFSAALIAGLFTRRRRGPCLAGAGVLALQAAYGAWLIPAAPQPVYAGLQLVLVQANIAQKDKWNQVLLADHLRDHTRLSQVKNDPAQAVGQTQKRVVIWPETAYPYLIEGDARAQARLQASLGAETTLIFGANRFVDAARSSARNSLFVLQGGSLTARYDKTHLVPFGEYLPLSGLLGKLGLGPLVQGLSGFSKGPAVSTLKPRGLPSFAPMICYEGIFARHLGALTERPNWILNISNDAWFGKSSGPAQHLNLVRFRAIEQGVSVVRSTGTGITAVLDPYGRVTEQLPSFREGALSAALPRKLENQPFFSILGIWTMPILLFAFGLMHYFNRKNLQILWR